MLYILLIIYHSHNFDNNQKPDVRGGRAFGKKRVYGRGDWQVPKIRRYENKAFSKKGLVRRLCA